MGRSQEIAALRAHYERALQGEGALCRIRGEAGSGKSTLLRSFTASLDQPDSPQVIAWAHCDEQTGDISPLGPWTQVLQAFSGVSEITLPQERLQDRRGAVRTLRSAFTELAPDLIELLLPGFGLAMRSAKLLRESSLGERLKLNYARPEEVAVAADRSRLQDQYLAIVEHVLAIAPLIVVMDDIDRSDEASLQMLTRIAERTRIQPILFLVATHSKPGNPALEETLQQISESIPVADIDLDLARVERGQALVAEYVESTVPGVGQEFIQQFAQHTGGHPLFVVELLEHLRRIGAVTQVEGRWLADPRLDWGEVPAGIGKVLSAQMARLDQELVDVLQAGSIEGDQFSIEVAAAALEKSPLSVARLLSRQAPGNLVDAVGTQSLGGERVTLFRFSHSLGRQHIYASIPELERSYLHEAVATQLESLAGDDTERIAAQLAYQFEQGRRDDRARHYYELAAQFAVSTCSLVEGTTHLQRALSLCRDRLEEMRVRQELATLTVLTGRIRDGIDQYAQARTIAEEERAPELTRILAGQAFALARLNDLDGAEKLALDAERHARERGDTPDLLSALETLATIRSKAGRHLEAMKYQAEAMKLVEELDNDSLLAGSLTKYGWYAKELGRYPEAIAALQQSLDLQNQGVANCSQLARTHNALADLYISLENYPSARRHMLLSVECWQRFDRTADAAIGLGNLANLANREGQYDDALDYGRQAYDGDLAIYGDDHPDLAFSLTCIGEALVGLARYDEAIESLEAAYTLRTRHGAPESNIAWTRWLLGRALVESGRDAETGHDHVAWARSVFRAMGTVTRSELGDIDDWLAARAAQGDQ